MNPVTCGRCKKDAPYAAPPLPGQVFICYECRMVHAWVHGSAPSQIATSKGRPPVDGETVLRYGSQGDWDAKRPEIHTVVNAHYSVDGFRAHNHNVGYSTPLYSKHCVKGKYPYWTHEDGSDIIPPK